MIRLLRSDELVVHTITSDNGKEFVTHMHVVKVLDADFFFGQPYHFWEHELNEHTNGLCREYFPKGTGLLSRHQCGNTRPTGSSQRPTEEGIEMKDVSRSDVRPGR